VKGKGTDDQFGCEGRIPRWTTVLGAGTPPFRLSGRGFGFPASSGETCASNDLHGSIHKQGREYPEFCHITCHVIRDGVIWDAEAELPKKEYFVNYYEYMACAIALIDISVDEGVRP
jgi:hypothetical protein